MGDTMKEILAAVGIPIFLLLFTATIVGSCSWVEHEQETRRYLACLERTEKVEQCASLIVQ